MTEGTPGKSEQLRQEQVSDLSMQLDLRFRKALRGTPAYTELVLDKLLRNISSTIPDEALDQVFIAEGSSYMVGYSADARLGRIIFEDEGAHKSLMFRAGGTSPARFEASIAKRNEAGEMTPPSAAYNSVDVVEEWDRVLQRFEPLSKEEIASAAAQLDEQLRNLLKGRPEVVSHPSIGPALEKPHDKYSLNVYDHKITHGGVVYTVHINTLTQGGGIGFEADGVLHSYSYVGEIGPDPRISYTQRPFGDEDFNKVKGFKNKRIAVTMWQELLAKLQQPEAPPTA